MDPTPAAVGSRNHRSNGPPSRPSEIVPANQRNMPPSRTNPWQDMTHIDDIEDALDSKGICRIEDAFRDLVQWPEEDAVRGAADGSELELLLGRVTAALEADRKPMPDDLVTCITMRSGDGMWLRDDRSYAAGARAVAARSVKWRIMFDACLDSSDEGRAVLDPYEIP